MKTNNFRRTIIFLYIIFSIYSFGAGTLDYFGIYEPWKLVGAAEFPALHQYQSTRIIAVFVMPMAFATVLGLIAFFFPDAAVKKQWLWLSMLGMIIAWVLSFTIQIPIQFMLHEKKDMQLIEELLSTNWYRFGAGVVQIVSVIIIFWQLIKIPAQRTAVA